MMRIDPQDREDIRFLMRQPDVSAEILLVALERAVVPPVVEIEEAFEENRRWVLELVR